MKKAILSFTLFIFLLSAHAQTGSITNIRVSQGTGSNERVVDILFDLSGSGSTYDITLEVSFDNGTAYTPIDPVEITGSLTVSPGIDIHLVWDGRISYPSNSTATALIKITATSSSSWSCGDPITDSRDGQTYNTVEIGTQCWMAENLNIGTRIDATSDQTDDGILEKYCYNDDPNNCDTYGGLYQWNEMMQYVTTEGVQGICPTGWHLPSDAEWDIVVNFLGGAGVAGGKMKEAGTAHWNSPNTGATNESGFTALPGGSRTTSGSFSGLGNIGTWWSSSENGSAWAWGWYIHYNYDDVSRHYHNRDDGFSVRCLKD